MTAEHTKPEPIARAQERLGNDMAEIYVKKDFLSNVDYLNTLVKQASTIDKNKIDSNLMYELVYAEMYLDAMETKITDINTLSNIQDIKHALSIVTTDINDFGTIRKKEGKNYKKLLKAKYKDESKGTFFEKQAYTETENAIAYYLRNSIPSVIVLTFAVIIMNLLGKFLGTPLGEGGSPNFQEVYSLAAKLSTTILNGVVMIAMMMWTLKLTLDLMYITMPFFRLMADDSSKYNTLNLINFISEEAQQAVKISEGETNIAYTKIKSYDRIKRNLVWLDSMLESIKQLEQTDSIKELLNELNELKKELEKSKNTKHYYYLVAKIEFLHNKYLELVEA